MHFALSIFSPMQDDDDYEELARWRDVLAAEYARTHDERIKEAIITLS